MPVSDLGVLAEMYRYNTWANERVFAACAGLDASALREEAPGTAGTIAETLKHLVSVEDAYLAMLKGQQLGGRGDREAYFAQDVAWFAARVAPLGEGYQTLLAAEGGASLDRTLAIPWFDFPVTAREGLLQVLSHSAQHRSQVLSVLGARGVEAPNIDYVALVGAARRGKE
jgi:uncharacterized damage-inducible protein DinB